MIVIFNGIKKDLHPAIAKKLLSRGLAQLIEKEKESEVKKTRKKVTDE